MSDLSLSQHTPSKPAGRSRTPFRTKQGARQYSQLVERRDCGPPVELEISTAAVGGDVAGTPADLPPVVEPEIAWHARL